VETSSALNVAQDVDTLIHNDFMKAPPLKDRRRLISEFIKRTSNNVLAVKVCACCAREKEATHTTDLSFGSIPNSHNLRPIDVHGGYDLYEGLLLEPKGVVEDQNSLTICAECESHLKSNKVPPLSLANGMWVGKVPQELKDLTLPERLMISKYFPSAYVFKLYPKQGAAGWDSSQLQSGMKGNVSTYRLDPSQVADMIDGRLLPHPPKVLAAVIAVTFVSSNRRSVKSLPKVLRVRREKIRQALLWLQKNNPLYKDIVISEERLNAFPDDDVPEEISTTVRYSEDVGALEREHGTYVPVNAVEDTQSKLAFISTTFWLISFCSR
jgi:hypothetical protein